MIIKDFRNNMLEFKDVMPGQCFQYSSHFYIKMGRILTICSIEDFAVDLESGIAIRFSNDDRVTVVEATIHIL